ncbi:hypothetical protein H8Z55_16065 [Mycobacteroides abscessus]|jgi:hypothetical protein|uniref:Uncharacterized protein n=4 Tax=Mycolicibacterium TaxID=1866885 RepID=A0A064CCL1_9MYCO|nr:hypothetical protein AB431_09280 [Mycobacterium sp. EPa45]APE15961.1 hypothetical protein BOH72_12770 [Mycobacterium sp. WY10]KDE98339.1 hypothetical protein Y900_005140 [Mycolicibacterium aromaticivorans JS19b1 = JCM 16368]MCA4748497.1 hypothetical protein [Mycobacteroides abscessus]MCV7218347.1 hypothetical protein [Mycolicibacterium crocinum]MCV7345519.1 hypothetical protein [Mycolicibacterium rhodesiae]QEN15324.1 hypothetical protein D3H54_20425 [Mycobacterium sp. ELW1]QYL18569.1 hypo
MASSPLPSGARSGRPARWRRWMLEGLYSFDRRAIADWTSLMSSNLQRPQGAAPTATTRYIVDLIHYTTDLRYAARVLAAHGHPAGRASLADAALDFNSALDGLCAARDKLLKVVSAEQVTDTDG